jgi:hypothetical protein
MARHARSQSSRRPQTNSTSSVSTAESWTGGTNNCACFTLGLKLPAGQPVPAITELATKTASQQPDKVETGPDGNMWVSYAAGQIARLQLP